MFSQIFRKHQFYRMKSRKSLPTTTQRISAQLNDNLSEINRQLGTSSDLFVRTYSFGADRNVLGALVLINSITDKQVLNENVLKPLSNIQLQTGTPIISQILDSVLTVTVAKEEQSLDSAIDELLAGKALLLVDGETQLIVIEARGTEMRPVEEPVTESVIRGPREGFNEDLVTNLSMIRRRIRNRNLQVETYKIGQQTNTQVCLVYIRGIVKDELVKEVRRRLSSIRIDSVMDSGYIEQWIEDNPYSIFPTVTNSEKPDVVSAKILEGRVAILVDGTPVVLMVPTVFVEFFQAAEDYYSRPYYASMTRFLRYWAFFVSAFLPALYIAFENFQKELIPPPLLIGFAESREGVPFPLGVEVLFMVILFEWLREAGVRMPRPIGQAVSIVGALVIGEAAVNAGMIGAPTVMVIAGAGITAFVVPSLGDVSALLRFVSIIVAGVFGLYGLFLFYYGIGVYLADLRSFGIPYFTPIAPMKFDEWKDVLVRFPLWLQKRRPDSLETVNQNKIGNAAPPSPPNKSPEGDRT
jgi:spore germination protein KA